MIRVEDNKRYYTDIYNDDFCFTKTNKIVHIDKSYQYELGKVKKFFTGILYHIAAFFLIIEGYLFRGIRVYGKKNLKKIKHEGYIMYSNHTSKRDAFIAHAYLAYPKRTYLICNKDALCIKGISWIIKAFGGLPLPDDLQAFKNLNKTIKNLISDKKAIMIYPEAHLWPYYNSVRPFIDTSFKYCVNNNCYCVPVAVTYSKPSGLLKIFNKPRIKIFVGEAIKPDLNLPLKERTKALRDYTYNFILDKCDKYSTYKKYEYLEDNKTPNSN